MENKNGINEQIIETLEASRDIMTLIECAANTMINTETVDYNLLHAIANKSKIEKEKLSDLFLDLSA